MTLLTRSHSFRKKTFGALVILLCFSSTVFAQASQVFFSPKGGCTRAVIEQVSRSRETLDVAIYSLSSEAIAQAILRAQARGVRVRVLVDRTQNGQRSSQNPFLRAQGVAVRLYESGGLMHNKFAVIDRKVLVTGSFNWTKNAEEDNAENLLVLSDKKLIARYEKNFEGLWVQGRDLEARKDFRRTAGNSFRWIEKILKEIIKFLLRQLRSVLPH